MARSGRLSASALLAAVTDPERFEPWDTDVTSTDPLGFADTIPYRERLERAARDAGPAESVITGVGEIDGQSVALIVGEFAFLAGTMGEASAERVIRAAEEERGLRPRSPAASPTCPRCGYRPCRCCWGKARAAGR